MKGRQEPQDSELHWTTPIGLCDGMGLPYGTYAVTMETYRALGWNGENP